MISGFNPAETGNALIRKNRKTLNQDKYEFDDNLHEVLSLAFTEFNLHILSKDQEQLVSDYIAEAEKIPAGFCNDQKLIQLDQYLGSLTDELYN